MRLGKRIIPGCRAARSTAPVRRRARRAQLHSVLRRAEDAGLGLRARACSSWSPRSRPTSSGCASIRASPARHRVGRRRPAAEPAAVRGRHCRSPRTGPRGVQGRAGADGVASRLHPGERGRGRRASRARSASACSRWPRAQAAREAALADEEAAQQREAAASRRIVGGGHAGGPFGFRRCFWQLARKQGGVLPKPAPKRRGSRQRVRHRGRRHAGAAAAVEALLNQSRHLTSSAVQATEQGRLRHRSTARPRSMRGRVQRRRYHEEPPLLDACRGELVTPLVDDCASDCPLRATPAPSLGGGDAGRGAHRHRLLRQHGAGVGRDDGQDAAELKGHTGSVRSVAVTPDGARVVTGSDRRHGYGTRPLADSWLAKGHAASKERGGDAGRGTHRHRL